MKNRKFKNRKQNLKIYYEENTYFHTYRLELVLRHFRGGIISVHEFFVNIFIAEGKEK